ncbi:PH domain-containing protein [Clostridium perfringens]|uniref:YdbS-like PH domain-containing protein n=1 Tax=Clostridium perfringens TaxID=1502 RepID=A0AAE8FUA7_CLOPF|nr:PH domain-containing protein [Clostridium perfringens]MCC5432777.1 PH domain-containing protein [Clostridium perfringens]MCC5436139.1 PH domain-containing protein [Clostridium perfringens]MDH5072184.1 Bacterial membrane flanked domain protein [Clostridium perfringens]MDK0544032.1 PH domain-containing protein [Clostridium perfringens]MDK0624009.1 PH domain-containing protein [Clostridium perfringens]
MNEKLANKEISQCNYEKESLNNREIKNSVRSLLYNIVKGMISDFGLGLIFVVFLKQWVYILIIVLVLLGIAISILSWKKEYMLLKGDEAHYHKGVFSKNTTIIPKKSFKSMDISQNLIERILGYKIVKIESPSREVGEEDIKMSLSDEDIDLLKSFAFGTNKEFNKELNNEVSEGFDLKENIFRESFLDSEVEKLKEDYDSTLNNRENINESKKVNINESEKVHINKSEKVNIKEKKISNKDLILYGFTSFNLFIAIIFIFNAWGKIEKFINSEYVDSFINGYIANEASKIGVIFAIVGLFLALIILKAIATVYYFVKYYNFTLLKEGENIKIKYGFFSTKEFSFKENSIKLIKLKSNPLRQLLRRYEINVVIKGYSGEGKEQIIMYPIGNDKEVQNIIREFIPKWSIEGEGEGIKHGKIFMILKPVLIVFIISLVAYLILKVKWVWLINIISLITISSSILKGRNINIKIEENKVRAVTGGFFRTIHILKGKDIQAVGFNTNPIQEKNNIGKIVIDYYSENSEEIKLPYMNKNYVEVLLNSSKGIMHRR